jgi:methionyl-tRNA synthetase
MSLKNFRPDFTVEKAVELVNAELTNDLANLVQRSTALALNPAQSYPRCQDFDQTLAAALAGDQELHAEASQLADRLRQLSGLTPFEFRNYIISEKSFKKSQRKNRPRMDCKFIVQLIHTWASREAGGGSLWSTKFA